MVRLFLSTFSFAVSYTLAAASGSAYPPPGLYQIDNETTLTSAAGPMISKSMTATSGADGSVVQTRYGVMPGDKATTVTRYAGTGPVTWCVPKYTPPAFPKQCSPSAAGACSGMEYSKWSKTGDKVWETSFTQNNATTGAEQSGADVRAVLNNPALANLPAEQRAAIQAQISSMPGQDQLRQQDKEIAAQMEKEAAKLPPEQARALRRQAAAMRGTPGTGARSGDMRWDVKERWTLIASSCKPK